MCETIERDMPAAPFLELDQHTVSNVSQSSRQNAVAQDLA